MKHVFNLLINAKYLLNNKSQLEDERIYTNCLRHTSFFEWRGEIPIDFEPIIKNCMLSRLSIDLNGLKIR
ncbi:hypothetical protein pah_c008o019 [Parachlamydia acanthamoebae str. Hall's coccus]|nr:hypothetical protein pah_c008o019 [Parachlamydia acanthamoebae str. Hall's coccus]